MTATYSNALDHYPRDSGCIYGQTDKCVKCTLPVCVYDMEWWEFNRLRRERPGPNLSDLDKIAKAKQQRGVQ